MDDPATDLRDFAIRSLDRRQQSTATPPSPQIQTQVAQLSAGELFSPQRGEVGFQAPAGSGDDGGGGGGGGPDNLETVTGAVNGVPATLEVQTDGGGWTEIT